MQALLLLRSEGWKAGIRHVLPGDGEVEGFVNGCSRGPRP